MASIMVIPLGSVAPKISAIPIMAIPMAIPIEVPRLRSYQLFLRLFIWLFLWAIPMAIPMAVLWGIRHFPTSQNARSKSKG